MGWRGESPTVVGDNWPQRRFSRRERAMPASVSGSERSSSSSEVCSEASQAPFVSDDDSSDGEGVGLESAGESSIGEESAGASDEDRDGADDGGGTPGTGTVDADANGPRCVNCSELLNLKRLSTADEWLECDGGCKRTMPPGERRVVCPRGCDFDMCTGCARLERMAYRSISPPSHSTSPSASPASPGYLSPASPASSEPASPVAPPRSPQRSAQRRADTTRRAAAPAAPLPAAPPVPTGLVTGLLGRMAARAAASQPTRGERAQAAFVEWQRGIAARRADSVAAARQSTGASTDEVTQEVPSSSRAAPPSAPTPGTGDYVLRPPPPIAFTPAEAGPALREQAAGILAGGSEQRRLWLGLARELLQQEQAHSPGPLALVHVPDAVPAHTARSPSTLAPPRRLGVEFDTSPVLPPLAVTRTARCECCDEDVGAGEVTAFSALQLFATLEDDLGEQDQLVETGLDQNFEVEALHRAARKHMYRAYVAARFGFLGQGVRVKIPDCVMAAIRSRYRAPGCDCSMDVIASCVIHGYAGFKEK